MVQSPENVHPVSVSHLGLYKEIRTDPMSWGDSNELLSFHAIPHFWCNGTRCKLGKPTYFRSVVPTVLEFF